MSDGVLKGKTQQNFLSVFNYLDDVLTNIKKSDRQVLTYRIFLQTMAWFYVNTENIRIVVKNFPNDMLKNAHYYDIIYSTSLQEVRYVNR